MRSSSPPVSAAAAAAAVCLALAAHAPSVAHAVVYDVGPGMPYATIGDVPWESLVAGDNVRIHWQAAAYHEKLVLAVHGTAAAPIVVEGVPGPGGELPVIDGANATTRSALNFWNEERGLVKIGGANTPSSELGEWIVLSGLELRGARDTTTFTGRAGTPTSYNSNAAAVFIEHGEHVTVRNCIIADSGNGLFVSPASVDIHVERNHIVGNGNPGSFYEHNVYSEALGITFEGNWLEPLCSGCGGNNLKDRSAGTIIRYNWIDGGNRALDLVDAEDSATLVADASYRDTWVYGNVMIERDDTGNSQVVHFGGDSGTTSDYRPMLHFYANTIVSYRPGNTTLFRLSSPGQTAEVIGNVLYDMTGGARLAILDSDGDVTLSANWLSSGWNDSFSGLAGTITDSGDNVEGATPSFADLASQDFRLADGSPCIDHGRLASGAMPVIGEYLKHLSTTTRAMDATIDIGAFEHGTVPADGGVAPPPSDGGVAPGTDGGVTPGTDGGLPPGTDGGVAPRTDGSAASADGGGSDSTVDGGCGCVVAGGRQRAGPRVTPAALVLFAGLLGAAAFRATRRQR